MANVPDPGPARIEFLAAQNNAVRGVLLSQRNELAIATDRLARHASAKFREDAGDIATSIEWGRALTIAAATLAGLLVEGRAHRPGFDQSELLLNVLAWTALELLETT